MKTTNYFVLSVMALAAATALAGNPLRSSLAALRALQQDHRAKLLAHGSSPQEDSKTLGALLNILQAVPLDELEGRMDNLEARLAALESQGPWNISLPVARTERMLQTTTYATVDALNAAVNRLQGYIKGNSTSTLVYARMYDSVVQQQINNNVTKLMTLMAGNSSDINTKLGALNRSLIADISKLSKSLDNAVAKADSDLSARAADILNEMDSRRGVYENALNTSLNGIYDSLVSQQADSQTEAIDTVLTSMDTGVDNGGAAGCCEAVRQELMQYIHGNVTAISLALNTLQVNIYNSVDEVRADLTAYADAIRDDLVSWMDSHLQVVQDTANELSNGILELTDSVEALISNVFSFETQADDAFAKVLVLIDETKAQTINEIQEWVNNRLLNCCPLASGGDPSVSGRRLGAVLENAEEAKIKLLRVLADRKKNSEEMKRLFGLVEATGETKLSSHPSFVFLKKVREAIQHK